MVEDIEFKEILVLSTVPPHKTKPGLWTDATTEGFGQVGVHPFSFNHESARRRARASRVESSGRGKDCEKSMLTVDIWIGNLTDRDPKVV